MHPNKLQQHRPEQRLLDLASTPREPKDFRHCALL